ncbi:MAG: hypothetical protein K1000chlam4_00638 [Chlamydiae bacterium]|nr:hypothetical protein [Chlamydiota bacterium]
MPLMKKVMKMRKVTYTLPEDVILEFHALVEDRKRSRFVANAIRVALEQEKLKLESAYISASTDLLRENEIEEWDSMEFVGEALRITL